MFCKRGKNIYTTTVSTTTEKSSGQHTRSKGRPNSRPKGPERAAENGPRDTDNGFQYKYPELRCGEFSIPGLIKPMIGPGLKEFQKELSENKYFVFSLVKDVLLNLIIGCLNFIVDSTKAFFTASYKEWSVL